MKEDVGWIYRDLYTINSIYPYEGIPTAVTILFLLFSNVFMLFKIEICTCH